MIRGYGPRSQKMIFGPPNKFQLPLFRLRRFVRFRIRKVPELSMRTDGLNALLDERQFCNGRGVVFFIELFRRMDFLQVRLGFKSIRFARLRGFSRRPGACRLGGASELSHLVAFKCGRTIIAKIRKDSVGAIRRMTISNDEM